MAIDARIVGIRQADGEVKLTLEGRQPGTSPGQSTLVITNPPEQWKTELAPLIGMCVWGGSSEIMLGDKQLAKRDGYVGITLVDHWQDVVAKYKSAGPRSN